MHKSLYFKDDTDRLHAKMQEERNGFIHIENYISSISKRLKDYTKQSKQWVIMITKNYNMIDWEANCRKKTPQNEEPKIGRKTITMLI